jgi:hypothetical protein
MRLPDWHIQIAYRILLSFGPKVFTRLLLLLSSTAFRASRGRHSRDVHLLFDHWNLGFINAQPCSFNKNSCITHQSTVVTYDVMDMLLRPDVISAFDIRMKRSVQERNASVQSSFARLRLSANSRYYVRRRPSTSWFK